MFVFVIIAGVVNIVVLLVSIHQMYLEIEISHPIYCILFSNLVSGLIASISDILILTLTSGLTITIIVKACAVFSVLFHCYCWGIVSILRYLYIIESNWLHAKFPEPWKLTIAALVTVYTLYFAGALANILVLTYNGWPFIEMYDMENPSRMICIVTLFSNYILPLSVSCYYYILLLRCRGVMASNAVADILKCETRQEITEEVNIF